MKCFERLVMKHIKSDLPHSLDPFQFAHRAKRSTEDAISSALHPGFTHLDTKDSHVRMLFIEFSPAFNTIIPQQLVCKLTNLGLNRFSATGCWTSSLPDPNLYGSATTHQAPSHSVWGPPKDVCSAPCSSPC
ncbi:hypothetical protein OYC64_004085 [Pagothenia borchgrevinki]|uniref:Reverse transcriptase n=1 Tax=Pagothenia borchgrevinki TaxID=8213 RepID=A0ABD2FW10_PAGBO